MKINYLDDYHKLGQYAIIEIYGVSYDDTITDKCYAIVYGMIYDDFLVYGIYETLEECKQNKTNIMSLGGEAPYVLFQAIWCCDCNKRWCGKFNHELIYDPDIIETFKWSEKIEEAMMNQEDDANFDLYVTLIEDTDIKQEHYRELKVEDYNLVKKYDLDLYNMWVDNTFSGAPIVYKTDFLENKDKSIIAIDMDDGNQGTFFLSEDDIVKKITLSLLNLCKRHIQKNRKLYSNEKLEKYLIKDILKIVYHRYT